MHAFECNTLPRMPFHPFFTYCCLMILLLIIFISSNKLHSGHFLRKISTFPFPYVNNSLGLDLPPPSVPTLELLTFNRTLMVLLIYFTLPSLLQ